MADLFMTKEQRQKLAALAKEISATNGFAIDEATLVTLVIKSGTWGKSTYSQESRKEISLLTEISTMGHGNTCPKCGGSGLV